MPHDLIVGPRLLLSSFTLAQQLAVCLIMALAKLYAIAESALAYLTAGASSNEYQTVLLEFIKSSG